MFRANNQADTGQELDAWYRLIAKVYKQALRDAMRGNRDARTWLDEVCPEWREMLKNAEIIEG